jgi:small subunit ribosomal protein S1
VLQAGQSLIVKVEKIDQEQRRISLVPVAEGEEPPAVVEKSTAFVEKPAQESMGTLGDILRKKFDKKK